MKANAAPEKIILSADRETGVLYDEWVIEDLTDNIKIEYTRTDAFIEKAWEWLNDNVDMYEAFDPDSKHYYMDKDKMIEGFTKYMEGE